jgi:endonuclease YncB( thermonuclease family)
VSKAPFSAHVLVTRVVDGDTCVVEADVGYSIRLADVEYRLARINCPEVHGATKDAGDAATAFTMAWVLLHSGHTLAPYPLFATTSRTDDWRRYIAEVVCPVDGANLSSDLLAAGHAVPWP